EAGRHVRIRAIGDVERDGAAFRPKAHALFRLVGPGPTAPAVVLMAQRAFEPAFARQLPFRLPAETVQAGAFRRAIARERHFGAAPAEMRIANAGAPGQQREAGAIERASRISRRGPQYVHAAPAQGGDRSAQRWTQLGFPVAGLQVQPHSEIGSSKPGSGSARAS